MTIGCPLCGENLELPDDVEIGRRILCPFCERKFIFNTSASSIAIEEPLEKPSSSTFTQEERDKAMEIFEQAQVERTSPWKRQYKGSVWLKALELFLVFGAYVFVRDYVDFGKLFASKDYVAETVKGELEEINAHNKEHANRMKGYALDFILKAEDGRYPFLWAEKEQKRVWNTLNTSIDNTEEHLKWLKSYQPKKKWDHPKSQSRYDKFDSSRREVFSKTIAFFEAQQKAAYAIRKLFAAYYLNNPDNDETLRRKIMQAYPNGLSDINTCHEESSLALDECGKEEESFHSFLRTFRYDFK